MWSSQKSKFIFFFGAVTLRSPSGVLLQNDTITSSTEETNDDSWIGKKMLIIRDGRYKNKECTVAAKAREKGFFQVRLRKGQEIWLKIDELSKFIKGSTGFLCGLKDEIFPWSQLNGLQASVKDYTTKDDKNGKAKPTDSLEVRLDETDLEKLQESHPEFWTHLQTMDFVIGVRRKQLQEQPEKVPEPVPVRVSNMSNTTTNTYTNHSGGGVQSTQTQNFNNTFGQTYDEDAALAKALLESMQDMQSTTNQRPVDLDRLKAQLRQARFEGDHIEEDRILNEIAQAEQKSEGANQQNDTSTEIGTDSIEIGDQESVMDLNNASQILRDPEDNEIKLVMAQGSCSRSQAIEALKANNNDIVEAIMSLTNDGNDLVSMINGEADTLETVNSEQTRDNPFTKLIESNDKNLVKIAFDTMEKIMTKIIKNPNELKYKRINQENKVICKKILDLSGGWEAIVGIGFQRDGKMLMNTISISSLSSIRDDIRRYSALAESATDGPDLVEKFRASVDNEETID